MKTRNTKYAWSEICLIVFLMVFFTAFNAVAASTEKKYTDPDKDEEAAPKKEPETAREFFLAAIKAFQSGDSRNAELHCQKAVSLESRYSDAHYLLGKIYLYRGAEKNRLEIRDFGIDSPETNYVRRYLKGRDELLRARSEFEIVTQIEPKAADAWLNLGICDDNLGNEEAGIKAYKKAVELGPMTTIARDAYNNLGLAQQAQGDAEAALASFQNALRIDPTFSPTRINLNRLLAKYPKLKKKMKKK